MPWQWQVFLGILVVYFNIEYGSQAYDNYRSSYTRHFDSILVGVHYSFFAFFFWWNTGSSSLIARQMPVSWLQQSAHKPSNASNKTRQEWKIRSGSVISWVLCLRSIIGSCLLISFWLRFIEAFTDPKTWMLAFFAALAYVPAFGKTGGSSLSNHTPVLGTCSTPYVNIIPPSHLSSL